MLRASDFAPEELRNFHQQPQQRVVSLWVRIDCRSRGCPGDRDCLCGYCVNHCQCLIATPFRKRESS